MLVRTVIWHQIEHEPQPTRLHLREHGVEVGHRAEVGHDGAIVGDVVAVVRVGRLEDRTHPDHVDAELLQVVELARDAAEVADAVTVAVLEAARRTRVDDGVLPPRVGRRHTLSRALWGLWRRRLGTAGSCRERGENDGRVTGGEEEPAHRGHRHPAAMGARFRCQPRVYICPPRLRPQLSPGSRDPGHLVPSRRLTAHAQP